MDDNTDWDAELSSFQRGPGRNQTIKPPPNKFNRAPPPPAPNDEPAFLPPPPPPPSASSPPSRAPPASSPFRRPPPPPDEAPPPPPSVAMSPSTKPRSMRDVPPGPPPSLPSAPPPSSGPSSSFGSSSGSGTTPSPSNSFGSSTMTSLKLGQPKYEPPSTTRVNEPSSSRSSPSYSPTSSTRSGIMSSPQLSSVSSFSRDGPPEEKKGMFSRLFGKKDKDNSTPKETSQSGKKGKEEDDDDDDDADPWADAGGDDADDDDGMNENPWAEFTDAKGNKLFFNRATGQASLGKIPSHSDQEQEDEDEDDDDDGMMNTLNDDFPPRKTDRARRNSSIHQEAWDRTINGRRGGDEPVKAMSVDKIVKSLSLIEKQVDLILTHSQNLSPAICEDLRTIRARVAGAQQALEEEGGHAVDNRGDVEALTEFERLPWNFNNMHVDHYRAAAVRVNHAEFTYREWHIPQYLSTFPLPPGVKTVTCVVKLPDMENALMTHTRINVTEKDTVSAAIHMAFAKCKGLGDEREYVLKGSGLKDYMYGDQPLMDYEYIRLCMRDSSEVKLTLTKRPPTIAPLPADAPDLPAEYRAKVNGNITILSKEDHRNLSSRDNWEEMKSVPMSELSLPFRVRVIGIDGVTEQGLPRVGDGITHIILRTFLFHGTQKIPDSVKETEWQTATSEPRWQTWLMAEYSKDTVLNALPRGVRIGFIVVGKDANEKEVPLGWVAIQLIDERGYLTTGPRQYRLWGFPPRKKGKHKTREVDPDFIYRACTRENMSDPNPAILHVHFDEYVVPVVAPLTEKYREPNPRVVGAEVPLKTLSKQQQKQLEDIIESDPLYMMSPDDKALVWMMRHSLTKYPQVLPKFLLCVNWGSPDHKFEAHRLMNQWAPPFTPSAALELLDAKYPDYVVREYAVNQLRRLPEDELRLYLLQFGQAIKYEPYHDSPLVRYLIERALRSPFGVGHHLFWHLKAELHNPQVAERFGVILEEYLSHAGHYTKELRKQNSAVLKLQRVAEMIVRLKREHQYGDADAMKEYVKELEKLNADFFGPMGKFQIPLNPKLEATTLIVEKCRYMSSKMVPLWLVFNNADEDAPPIYLIFKSGDDLRQDILTLQMLQVMDKIWLSNGLDLKMKPYKTVATGVNDNGDGVGMIEVVMNSDTTSGIQLKYGGGAVGALKMDPLDLFLKDHNKGKALYDKAVDNFVCSCAGYCVATFVLGIGDRHNGNIMVTKDGHLFHIDFGHFLGNFKKKFGVNRERAAFVFTPEMAFVMGGKKYKNSTLFKKFLVLCSKAFKTLRANATLMENLFNLMVAAGMPELMKEEDIHYLRDKLYLTVSEKKADKKLHGEIKKSLESTYRRIDNWIHNMVHG